MGGLRVGLTGGLGSGKTTVLGILEDLGAHGLSADQIGRELMEPGTAVFAAIVAQFGDRVVTGAGRLDRGVLAQIAFADGRVEELNAIIHPAAIARQAEMAEAIFRQEPGAVLVVESALIFETKHADRESWRSRFDRMVLVTAPEETKIARFVARSGGADPVYLQAEARRRLARMIPDEVKEKACDFVIRNDGSLQGLRAQVKAVWEQLFR